MNKWLFIWLIFVAGWYLIPWWNKVYFLWDDIELLMQFRHPVLETFFVSHQYQFFPVFLFFYSLETNLFGVNPSLFLLTSVILHLINIYLVYKIIFRLTKGHSLGLAAAILVSFNKSYFTVIFWPAIQSNLLLTTFILLSFHQFINLNTRYRKFTLILFAFTLLMAGLSFGFGVGAGLVFAAIVCLFWRKKPWWKPVFLTCAATGLISVVVALVFSIPEVQLDRKFELSLQRIFNLGYFTAVGISQAVISRFFLPGFIPNIYSPANIAVMIALPAIVVIFFAWVIIKNIQNHGKIAPLFLFVCYTVIPYFIASLARSGPGALGGLAERYVYLPFFAFILALVYGLWLAGITKKTFPRFLKIITIGYIPIVAVGQLTAISFELNNLFLP